MPDNWARKALESAVANGLLQGYDGKIMPDAPLTRAQMAAIVVRAFGATEEGDISSYTDVGNKWYKSDIAKAYKMGVMQGYAGKMNPESNITREQAFTILARALKLDPATSISKQFEDVDEISDFAKGAIYALVNAGYVQGSNNRLYPKNTITRAEFAQVMYNLIQQYINREGEYAEVANGNVMINVPNVTLKGVTVDGDLIIGDGVGGGDITLEDVIVTGRMVVRGGGQNSIIIRGKSSVSNVVAAKVDGAVRVKVEGDAEVEIIIVDDGSDDIIIEGNVGSVEVKSDVTVTISNANIGSVKVAENAEAAKIVVSADSKVENVEVQAQNAEINVEGTVNNVSTSAANTVVTGKGTVKKVEVKKGADGTKVETPKTQITVDEGVTGVTAGGGKEVEGGKTVTNNDDGSDVVTPPTGGGGTNIPTVIPVTGVAVTGEVAVGSNLTAQVSPSGASVNYQWLISDSEDGTYANITEATGATYSIDAEDFGKYIKVKVTGTGNYTGTAESDPVGPVGRGMIVTPETGSTIKVGETITVTAPGADDLRIMLWADSLDTVDAARDAYAEKVFSSRISDLVAGGMEIDEDNGVFTITITPEFIAMLEAGTRYSGASPETGAYEWTAGSATTWLITPEFNGVLWSEYATWNGEKVDDTLFRYFIGTAPAVEPTTGVTSQSGGDVDLQEFTFGFKSASGVLTELELDIYLGDNTGENRDYSQHLGINLPAGSTEIEEWVELVVGAFDQLDAKFHSLLFAAGYDENEDPENNINALKQNIFYTPGEDGAGTWTIRLNTAFLGVDKIEFLVAVKDNKGAQWGENNFNLPGADVKAYLFDLND